MQYIYIDIKENLSYHTYLIALSQLTTCRSPLSKVVRLGFWNKMLRNILKRMGRGGGIWYRSLGITLFYIWHDTSTVIYIYGDTQFSVRVNFTSKSIWCINIKYLSLLNYWHLRSILKQYPPCYQIFISIYF